MGLLDFHINLKNIICCLFNTPKLGLLLMFKPRKMIYCTQYLGSVCLLSLAYIAIPMVGSMKANGREPKN